MGNMGICGKSEKDLQLEYLTAQIVTLRKKAKKDYTKNETLMKDNLDIVNEINNTSSKNKKLVSQITHYKNILENHKVVADSIIESDLNCKWMDDKKEKEYLISIVKFIHNACVNTTTNLKKPRHTKNVNIEIKQDKHVLKKNNTVDTILNEINDIVSADISD
jgi:hypothetical protein